MNPVANLSICILLFLCSSKIILQNGYQPNKIPIDNLQMMNHVLVESQSSQLYMNEKYKKVFLSLKYFHKSKKEAYQQFLKRYNSITKKLIRYNFIPNQEAMVKSKIHQKYHNKSKKWQLTQDVQEVLQILEEYNLEKVNSKSFVNYLNEKLLALGAFNAAKNQLQKFLKQSLNFPYRILYTKDIQIIGKKIQNQQVIEQQIEQQYNQSEINNIIIQDEQNYYQETKKQQKEVVTKIKVLFKIGLPYDIEDQEEEVSQISVSQFQEDLLRIQQDL